MFGLTAIAPTAPREWARAGLSLQRLVVMIEGLQFTVALALAAWLRWTRLEEAETVCRELGLGPLIDRMPAGMLQGVPETGWQRSQGERSRLFMFRALLQKSEMVVLDETYAALDPEKLRPGPGMRPQSRQPLLVVAHP